MTEYSPGDEVEFTIGTTKCPAVIRATPQDGSRYYTVETDGGTRWSVTAAGLTLLAKAGEPR